MPKQLKLKVCGLRDNLGEVVKLKPDFAGFIFYKGSPRYVGLNPDFNVHAVTNDVKKVGVFVDAPFEEIVTAVDEYLLDIVQLHGKESPEFCMKLKDKVEVIKVFSGNEAIEPKELAKYEPCIDYFLFDTRTEKHGGTGKAFDWSKLRKLNLKKPLILSGGVSLDNIQEIMELAVDIYAVDVNSKFEISPGLKNIELLSSLKKQLS